MLEVIHISFDLATDYAGKQQAAEVNMGMPIWIIEPEQTGKRELTARKISEGGQKKAHLPEVIDLYETKQRLKEIREDAAGNAEQFKREIIARLQKNKSISLKNTTNNVEAVDYITGIAGDIKTISINNSSAVIEGLKPWLIANKFNVINSYLSEFDIKERKVADYWDLPRLENKNLAGTFEVVRKIEDVEQKAAGDVQTKKYVAVLGANAVSVEGTTIFFLQHFSNIYKDLEEAEKVVIVVTLDKIVRSRQDALFQTRCMGIFGMESIVLGIEPALDKGPSLDELNLPLGKKAREFHIIILDNGHSKLLQSKFRDLFLCIGCRACNKHCPIRHSFSNVSYIWTPKNYLTQFLRSIESVENTLDTCLHCEACHLECPLSIDLPYLMWQAKIDHVSQHGTSLSHKILGRPELLAKAGTVFAPLANWMMQQKLIRTPMEIITGVDRKTKLPKFHFNTLRKWF